MEAVTALGPGAGDRTRVFLDTPVEAFATLADEAPSLRERLVLQIDSARVLPTPPPPFAPRNARAGTAGRSPYAVWVRPRRPWPCSRCSTPTSSGST